MENFDIGASLKNLYETSGLTTLFDTPLNLVMIVVACVLIYLAIVKKYEPLLLLPIAFGMLLANLPLTGLMDGPIYAYYAEASHAGKAGTQVIMEDGTVMYQYIQQTGGLLYYLYQGVKLGIYPPLIF
ncbi:MAG TPA: sodium ion-translocating decarboxylase subunit beta, partial [Candidatus Limiplasma sp.]|nr:sodium ion-translocating decarboxylase subunit beta [Candidatus Limiplasma sp.]